MTSQQENHKKLTDFFDQEYQSLRGYVQSRMENTVENDAEDIVQEVALTLFSRRNGSPIDNIAGFVYRSITNKIVDMMRTRKRRVSDETLLEHLWTDFAEKFYGPADNAYPPELTNRLKRAIAGLKPLYRDIILAVDFEGYNYREIAERTGIPQGTLMSRRHRALSILLRNLENNKHDNT